MSKYPVGATWKGIDEKNQRIGYIWLDEIRGKFEIWKWRWTHTDGSYPVNSFNWAVSYQSARNAIPVFNCRFKRIK